MVLPIIAYGAKVLRNACVDIDSSFNELDILLDNMFETMYAASGVGLAAPQINKSLRLFIIDTSPFKDEESPDHIICKKVFINPRILSSSGDSWTFNEGCLSIPDVREDVNRLSNINVEYYDEKFNKITESFSGLNARVILHEYDHIEGILFIDKITPLRKRMIKGKLFDISNGKFNSQYNIRAIR
ncbi:MAG: peptide deformylase [Flavobacteriales bacterium]|jgi:peptide deformylase